MLAIDAEVGRQKARELERIELEKKSLEEVSCLVLWVVFFVSLRCLTACE
jgi:hypothetical protein